MCFSDNREETYHPLTYICIWDHNFKKQQNQNPELRQFISHLDIMDRLDPRVGIP